MRILYIWHAAVEKEYRKLLWEIAKKGHDVHLVTAHRWTESSRDQRFSVALEDKVLHVYPLRVAFRNHIRSFFFINLFRMISLLRKIKPEIVYIKEEPYSLAAFQWVWLISLFSQTSKIVIESDENLMGNHPFVYKWIEKYVFTHIQGIASVPTAGIELYRRKGFRGKQFKTSYFVNTDIFHPVSREEAYKAFPEFKDGVFAIGYVGRITAEKGLDTVIEALEILQKKGYSLCLYLLGKVAEGYKNNLEKLLSESMLKEKVCFLPARPMEQLVYFYNMIDVLVLPSKSTSWWIEQFGRVIVEAHACGTPVIGSSSGEIPIVVGNENLVFPEGESERLAFIIERFLTGEYSKKAMAENLIKRVNDVFSLSTVAKTKLQIMEEVIRGE